MSLQALWTKLDGSRSEVLRRAEQASKLTLPHVFPERGHTETRELPTPYQSIGAMGVNNLASKLLLTLFPPTSPFFRFVLEEADLADFAEEGDKAVIQQQLSGLETAAQIGLEKLGIRPMLWEALVHLLVTGNGCLMLPERGDVNFFDLRRFCVERAPDDRVASLVIKEVVDRDQLSPELMALLPPETVTSEEQIPIFTGAMLQADGTYKVWQEVGAGAIIPNTLKEYKADELPFVTLRFNSIHGEHYGRGLVEQYAGDLISAESLSESIDDMAKAMARNVWIVRAGSSITPQRFADAQNGEVLTGNPDDVGLVQANVSAALSVVASQLQDVAFRLRQVFLMQTTRQAERVTAEEIRLVAQELQDTLGGTFSLMSEELQLPLIRLVVRRLRADGKFPDLPKDLVEPKIVTGIEGLGRNQDSQRLLLFWQDIVQTVGPEAALQHLDTPKVIQSFAAARGIDATLIKSEEQVQQEQEAAQQAALAQQAVGPGIQAAAQLAQQ